MRILLTGANGQVGRCLKQQKPEDWEMIAADSQTLDITDAKAVSNMVKNFEPDAIINAAGYTNLEAAELDKQHVFAVNAEGTRILAQEAADAGIRFIHISSDYVFDGQKRMPYVETDYPNPLSSYAKSKLAGELLALSANPDSIIVRSSWVFSEYGNNFVKDIIDQARNGKIAIATDKIGCPTYAGDLARLMIELAQNRQHTPRGIFHFCGDKAVNRYEFAQAILKELAQSCGVQCELNEAPPISEHTPRPPYSVLSCEKIRALGYTPSDWQAALKRLVPQLAA
ncbi:MAG: dTDP-4-dehydrorhamnose reductase [Alysiella sp.]|uniref:dTDP-4-dehydrorhamnose reductase n=1 Tax=Alysiella sp. TaxID=1872483 RepID=UPI0026DD8D16|nr:dTDP-4-dehydrorhamnose reductase [Alysiella sp.]MDO4434341.1 dTDP-4-dehydrorhamnose reductase [Alysiella sp.]